MRRKGELSPAAVDSGWPHQEALPATMSVGDGYNIVHDFCRDLSLCRRGHSVIGPDRGWWKVYRFAEKAHAEKFKQRFGGEWFDPAKRGKGKAWMVWKR